MFGDQEYEGQSLRMYCSDSKEKFWSSKKI